MVALLGTNVAEQRPVSMSIAVSTGVGYWFSTLWGMQSGFEWWVCCCFDVDGRLICLVSVCRWDTMICKACESSYVPWFLVLLVASALMLLLPWWPVDCPLHFPQVVPRMMVSLQSWLILSTVVSGCGSVVHSSSMRRGRLPSVWSIWCQLWRVVRCPWYHMDSLPKMSFSYPIVWCLVCWIWWWYVLARSWNVGWWLLWLFATMSCCWFRFFFLLCYCLCLLMLLHNLSWCCCFGHVASRCRCSLVGTMFLQSMLILRWSYSDPSSLLIVILYDDLFLSWLSDDGLSVILKLICIDGAPSVEGCEECSPQALVNAHDVSLVVLRPYVVVATVRSWTWCVHLRWCYHGSLLASFFPDDQLLSMWKWWQLQVDVE